MWTDRSATRRVVWSINRFRLDDAAIDESIRTLRADMEPSKKGFAESLRAQSVESHGFQRLDDAVSNRNESSHRSGTVRALKSRCLLDRWQDSNETNQRRLNIE